MNLRRLHIVFKYAVLFTSLTLIGGGIAYAQTQQQLIAQYCNANDQSLINWLIANGPNMSAAQLAQTSMQLVSQLSPACQSLMSRLGQNQAPRIPQPYVPPPPFYNDGNTTVMPGVGGCGPMGCFVR
jgi:hypothetical protein